jgi:hypothetical protein
MMQYDSSTCDAANLTQTLFIKPYSNASTPYCYSQVFSGAGTFLVSTAVYPLNSTSFNYTSYTGQHCTGTATQIIVNSSNFCGVIPSCQDLRELGFPGVWQTVEEGYATTLRACDELSSSAAAAARASGAVMVAVSAAMVMALF